MTKVTKLWLVAVGLSAVVGSGLLLNKPEDSNKAVPSPSTASITSGSPEPSERAVDPFVEQLPVPPVSYGQAVKVGMLEVTATKAEVVQIKVSNSGEVFEFESRYGFQFIDAQGVGSLAADTIGFQMVGTRIGEVQVDGPVAGGTLLLVDRETGMPVGAWK